MKKLEAFISESEKFIYSKQISKFVRDIFFLLKAILIQLISAKLKNVTLRFELQ